MPRVVALKRAGLALALCASNSVHADCESVLQMAKNVSVMVTDAATFDTQARAFCDEQRKTSGRSGSGSLGVTYGAVGISAGGSRASTSEMASKTCDASSATGVSSNAYRNYLQTVAPEALPAYQACVKARDLGVITINFSTVTAKRLAVSVSNTSLDSRPTTRSFAFQGETNSSCFWGSGGLLSGKSIALEGNRTEVLTCDRTDPAKQSAVTVFAETRGDVPVGLIWGAYKGDEPVNELNALAARLAVAETELATLMPGAVIPFNAKDCPLGWTEYKPPQGRFVRGIDKASAAAPATSAVDPDGLRAPGGLQQDMLASHDHNFAHELRYEVPGVTYTENKALKTGGDRYTYFLKKTLPTGGAETRPKNVALLYCSRD